MRSPTLIISISVFMIFVGAFGADISSASPSVKGEFQIIDGIRVLHVWGSHYEMGYAHGYLLADDIVELFDKILVPLIGNAEGMEENRVLFRDRYAMPAWHMEETQGIIDGIAASSAGLFVPVLGRDLDADDLGTMDSLSDIRTVYECSSFAAWIESTTSDAVLLGESALARNLDWFAPFGRPYMLAKNTLVIGREPDDARATLTVSFSGLTGCYSCMNEAGVATTRMMSNHGTPGWQMDFSRPFTPLNIVMRDALQAQDVDGDGASTVADLALALSESVRSSAYNIMIVGPTSAGHEPVVAEINHKEFALRSGADNTELPSSVLASVNNMRKLYPPYPDGRYNAMKRDVLGWNGEITLSRMWEVLQSMSDQWMATQAMIFVPFNRSLAISYTDAEGLAPFKSPVWLAWDDVFDLGGDDDDVDDDVDDDDSDDDDWLPDDDSDDDDANDDDSEAMDNSIETDEGDSAGRGCGC